MDMRSTGLAHDEGIEFTGHWRDYLPIVASNVLLTIITVGIYRSWAKARDRRYLWSNTVVMGDPLQWRGTGKEIFLGLLIALPLFTPVALLIGYIYGPGAPGLAIPLLIYAASAICYLAYLSIFYRAALDWLSLDEVEFTLDADMDEWLNFYLRTALLTVATAGLAVFFYQYRRWKFVVARLEIHGAGSLARMGQSNTGAATGAEGVADAFDLGAF